MKVRSEGISLTAFMYHNSSIVGATVLCYSIVGVTVSCCLFLIFFHAVILLLVLFYVLSPKISCSSPKQLKQAHMVLDSGNGQLTGMHSGTGQPHGVR